MCETQKTEYFTDVDYLPLPTFFDTCYEVVEVGYRALVKPENYEPRNNSSQGMSIYDEFELFFKYDHQSQEKATQEDPGCDACVTVTAVYRGDNERDIMNIFTEEELELYADSILEKLSWGI